MIQNAMCEYAELVRTVDDEFVYCNKYDKLCEKEECKVDKELIKKMAPKNIPKIKNLKEIFKTIK